MSTKPISRKPTEEKTVEHTWDSLADQFHNFRGVSPRWSWLKNGLSERADRRRVKLLEAGREGRGFQSIVKKCTLHEIQYLLRRSEVNLEQAQAAARVIVVTNVTIFIGFFVLVNQFFPGFLKDILESAERNELFSYIGLFIGLICLTTLIVSYAHGGVAQARDLKHLLQLEIAKRNFNMGQIASNGSYEDTTIESDLRNNFLSDI